LPNFYVVLALYALWPAMRGTSSMPPLWQFLTFTQNIGLKPGTAFSHAWSLCVEEQFYFLLPALALLIAMLRKSLVWAWAAVLGRWWRDGHAQHLWSGMTEAELGNSVYTAIYYASWCRFDELVCGVAVALLKNYHAGAWTRVTSFGNWTLAAGAALLAVSWNLLLEDHYGYAMTVWLSAAGPELQPAAGGGAESGLAAAALARAGRGQPGLVVVRHLPEPQAAVLAAARAVAGAGLGSGKLAGAGHHERSSVFTGWLLYRLVETPFMKLRDRYVPSNYASSSQSHQTVTA
jgi:peptidoglycan/LPS O-acetylase OafA/YrhL